MTYVHRPRKDIEEQMKDCAELSRKSKASDTERGTALIMGNSIIQVELLLDIRELLTDMRELLSPAKPKTYTLEELIAMQPPEVQEKVREEYEALKGRCGRRITGRTFCTTPRPCPIHD